MTAFSIGGHFVDTIATVPMLSLNAPSFFTDRKFVEWLEGDRLGQTRKSRLPGIRGSRGTRWCRVTTRMCLFTTTTARGLMR